MGNFSLTQTGNLTALIGVVMFALRYFEINIAQEEIQALLAAGLSFFGIILSWIGRYRKGDLTKLGFRK